jgi:hypothetical protein
VAADRLLMSSSLQGAGAELRRMVEGTDFQNPAAVTLTLKKRAGGNVIDQIKASANFRHFRNRLNHAVLGSAAKRHGAQLLIVPVLEISADNRLHYHCVIDRPYYCSFERFSAIVKEQWSKTDFGYRQIDIQDQADTGWTDYILKQRQKGSVLDSIDWDNCHLIAG